MGSPVCVCVCVCVSGISPQPPEERDANKEQSHQHRQKAAPNPCQEATGEVTQRKQQMREEEQEEEPSSQDPLSLLIKTPDDRPLVQKLTEEYLKGVRTSTYGGALEMYAYTHITNQPVEVYIDEGEWYAQIFSTATRTGSVPPKRVVYQRGIHYDELLGALRQHRRTEDSQVQERPPDKAVDPSSKESRKAFKEQPTRRKESSGRGRPSPPTQRKRTSSAEENTEAEG